MDPEKPYRGRNNIIINGFTYQPHRYSTVRNSSLFVTRRSDNYLFLRNHNSILEFDLHCIFIRVIWLGRLIQ